MSKKNLQNLLALCESMDENSSMVEERMRNAGVQADPVVVDSMAKYWSALEKLAAE